MSPAPSYSTHLRVAITSVALCIAAGACRSCEGLMRLVRASRTVMSTVCWLTGVGLLSVGSVLSACKDSGGGGGADGGGAMAAAGAGEGGADSGPGGASNGGAETEDPSAGLADDNLWNPVTKTPGSASAVVLPLSTGEYAVLDAFKLEESGFGFGQLTLLRYAEDGSFLGRQDVLDTELRTLEVHRTVLGPDDDVLACGAIGSSTAPDETFPGQDPSPEGATFAIRVNQQGQLAWARQFPGDLFALCTDLGVDAEGNVYFSDRAAVLRKLSSDGELLWEMDPKTEAGARVSGLGLTTIQDSGGVNLIVAREVDAAEDPDNSINRSFASDTVGQVGLVRFDSDGTLLDSSFHNVDQRSTGRIARPTWAVSTPDGEALFLGGNSFVIDPRAARGSSSTSLGSYVARFDRDRQQTGIVYPSLEPGPSALSRDGSVLFQAGTDKAHPAVLFVSAWKSDLSELLWQTATELVQDEALKVGGPLGIRVTRDDNVVVTQSGSSRLWAATHYRGSDGKLLDGRARVVTIAPPTPPRAKDVTLDKLPVEALRPLTGVVAIAGPCALVNDGTVWCWGSNASGLVGFPKDTVYIPYALQIEGVTDAVELHHGGRQSCAVLKDRTVRCWGITANGGLGNPTATTRIAGAIEPQGLGKVEALSMGGGASCAVLPSLELKCWGSYAHGALGERAIGDDLEVPEALPGVSEVSLLSMGSSHACYRADGKSVWCWGSNIGQALGRPNASLGAYYPPGPALTFVDSVTQLGAFNSGSCALLDTGRLQCWGAAIDGFFGVPMPAATYETTPVELPFENVRELIPGRTCALQAVSKGSNKLQALCWGRGFAEAPDFAPRVFDEFGEVSDFDIANDAACALGPEGTVSCADGGIMASPGDGFVLQYSRPRPSLLYAGDPSLLE